MGVAMFCFEAGGFLQRMAMLGMLIDELITVHSKLIDRFGVIARYPRLWSP